MNVTATPYSGYYFHHWVLDGAIAYGDSITVTMDSDHDLEAYFSQPALKTTTDGYFYVPNVATDLLKIEMLFDNKGLVGDQRGGKSPYSSITCYPDGTVDLKDSYFIDMNFGKNDGMEGWDYMSDIVPDRTCDLKDSYIVNINFGKVGTYISDLSGVTVTFNTGEEMSPDSNGFVEIPQGATNFTVKRNGTLIGAMIIFW